MTTYRACEHEYSVVADRWGIQALEPLLNLCSDDTREQRISVSPRVGDGTSVREASARKLKTVIFEKLGRVPSKSMPHCHHVFGELYCLLLIESREANNASSMVGISYCTAPASANLGRLKENLTMLCQVHLNHTTSLACEGTQDDSYGMLRLPLLSPTKVKILTAATMEKEEDA